MHPLLVLLLALTVVVLAASAAEGGPRAPGYLRCEYLVDPRGVDMPRPRLSWEVRDARRGAAQSAYRVLVASNRTALQRGRADLWDSGRVASPDTVHVEYAGRPLISAQCCWWKVRTWDSDGRASAWSAPATWQIGILSPSDWKAAWIGDAAPAPARRPAHNGYHSALVARPDARTQVRLDLGSVQTVDGVRLWPARPYDWQPDTPGFLFPLRFRVSASTRADGADARVVSDRGASDVPSPGAEPLTLRFAAIEARTIVLEVLALRPRDAGNYAFALAEMEVLAQGRNVALNAAVTAQSSIEEGGWSARHLTDGDTVSHSAVEAGPVPPPRLRKEFVLRPAVRRATLFVTALGLYEARLNGQAVGDHVLAPEWTDYHRRVQYQTYDVTPLVRTGTNALGIQLADGWYCGRIGLAGIVPGGPVRRIYGPKPLLLAQLRVEYADGSTDVVATDTTWKSSTGPVRSADILDGEECDARRETPGWDEPGFGDASWASAVRAAPAVGALVAQPNEPIRVTRTIAPVALSEPKPGVYVYDLGQNMVGWCRATLAGSPGTTAVLRYAEALNPDETLYTANLRGAPQTDRYTFAGSAPETFEPRFTYHGFRYVEITGLAARPRQGALLGCVVHSSSPEVGHFECSNALLNRLWQNILWTQRANLMSVPTDCPQRDERLGWMGDIQAFCPTAALNMDLAGFFTKWLRDVRDDQAVDGRFPDFAPHPYGPDERFSGAPAWADAGVVVPWRAYVEYGDRRVLSESLPAAARWLEYVRARSPDLIWRHARGNDYNDWLNADTLVLDNWPRTGGSVPNDLFATAFFAHSADLVARMAAVLGRRDEADTYRSLATRIRQAFNKEFVQPDGRMRGDTQAGYALALSFDLLPENLRPLAARHMVDGLKAYRGHLSTGIQSTIRAMLELTRWGYTDEAYRILLDRTYPSWLYSVDQGATTIWERWDGYVKGRGFQDPGMNSLNHWAFGAVGEWMYGVILGISPEEDTPGWRHFVVRPRPGGALTWARGSYRSIAGRIALAWRAAEGRFTLDLTVPPGTSATVHMPAKANATVAEGGHDADGAPGVRSLGRRDGDAMFEVGGGTYHFEEMP